MRIISYTKKSKRTGEIYDCRIWVDDKKKKILKRDCSCWNFVNRRIKKEGKGFLIKYTEEDCKHLRPQVEALFKQGYEIEIKSTNDGAETCNVKLRKAVIQACKGQCHREDCNETENLKIHRMQPGYMGGKYGLMNCVALCDYHHKQVHSGEFT